MGTQLIRLIALIITIGYGMGFALFDDVPTGYVIGGAFVVVVAWLLSGFITLQQRK